MRKLIYLLAILNLSLLVSCASKKTTPRAANAAAKSAKTLADEQRAKEHELALQDLRDHNQVLNKKAQMSSGTGVQVQARPQTKKIEMVTNSDQTFKSEKDLYGELLGAYDRNNEIAFMPRLQAFQRRYPKSSLLDDALYLGGLMALSNKNYGPALKHFNLILKHHPLSNKASASLFAKGVTLKKMNLLDQSRQAFVKVRQAYPGSPESLRAETELKLLK